jgi:crotonobetainyl-CoA:carnitine CoA-transferase CaiB-like acyl-CoA transferase
MKSKEPNSASRGSGSLFGLTVVDLARVLAGPFCTQMLADHGATVIKVEPPNGDETRSWGPPFEHGQSAYFSGINRNKRSIALDLASDLGREVVLRLLETADVLVHNFKSGTMEKWGLGYDETLRQRFPRLVLCHISGFGARGPLGGFPGYDAVVQAMTGLMSINGDPSGGPMRMGTPIVDIGTGLIACNAILAALRERERSGIGQMIEVPLYDAALSLLHPQAANALMSGKVPIASGNSHPNISPYDMFKTRTKPLYLAVGNNGQFIKLCQILDLPDLPTDPRFLDNADRVENRAALTGALSSRLATVDAEEIEPRFLAAGVPAGVVRNVAEALSHPHTLYREMVVTDDPYTGTGIAATFSRTPGAVRSPPPLLGEDSVEVLRTAGYKDAEIQELIRRDIVRTVSKPE